MNVKNAFKFTIRAESPTTRARTGYLETPHGPVNTPAMIFCATKGCFRGMTMEQARGTGAQIVLSNAYHLIVNPGPDAVAEMGGMHKMMNWHGPTMTDSGGYQIFSLQYGSVSNEVKGRRKTGFEKTLAKIDEKGAIFQSYKTGDVIHLTPELSIESQRKIGADLIYVLDECTPCHVSKEYTEMAMKRSQRWGLRSIEQFNRTKSSTGLEQALYGIVQGGVYPDLRERSAQFTNDNDFFGNAIGGSLGKDQAEMISVVRNTAKFLFKERPIHLLGIGGIRDIWNGVASGIDTFDCVHPIRIARHGAALYAPDDPNAREHMNLKNARFRTDERPIVEGCDCYTCRTFSRRYLNYLINAKEPLFGTLIAIHNMTFLANVMKTIRAAIKNGTFGEEFKRWKIN